MKKREIEENRSRKIEELVKTIARLKNDIVKLNLEAVTGKTKNLSVICKKKREVAQLKTILRQKEISKT